MTTVLNAGDSHKRFIDYVSFTSRHPALAGNLVGQIEVVSETTNGQCRVRNTVKA